MSENETKLPESARIHLAEAAGHLDNAVRHLNITTTKITGADRERVRVIFHKAAQALALARQEFGPTGRDDHE